MSNLLDLPAPRLAEVAIWSDPPSDGEFLIHGVTAHGKAFRPSDWSERLCGVMACFRPGGERQGRDGLIGYSPFVRPVSLGDAKCVLVNPALRDIEPMALDFVVSFARDNGLRITAVAGVIEAR